MNAACKALLSLTALLVPLLGVFSLVSHVSATLSGTLTVGSLAIAPDGTGTVEVRSNVPSPGLGAWSIDLTYDPGKVSVLACNPRLATGACNIHLAPDKIRLAGASASGLIGDSTLATILVQRRDPTELFCQTPFAANPIVFSDASVGEPQPITVTVISATLTDCPGIGFAVPTTTSTPIPILVAAGAREDSVAPDRLLIALAAIGAATLAGCGFLRLWPGIVRRLS